MNTTHKAVVLLLAMLSAPVMAGDLSFHTFSAHIKEDNREEFTPGIAFTEGGYRFGYLRNSFKINSFYGTKIFRISDSMRLGLGVITGYEYATTEDGTGITGKNGGAIPFVAVEKDITDNISVLWFGRAVNLIVKFRVNGR